MKTLKMPLLFTALLTAAVAFTACDNDDDYYYVLPNYPNALVTVKNAPDSTVFLQLDDETTLYPLNLRESPYGGKEVRALVNFVPAATNSHGYTQAVYINWIDSILTKATVPTTEGLDSLQYGNDPVEIVNDWVTIAEDGYLTLRFRTLWGNTGIAHSVNLITGVNPSDPYEVEFRHNINGDTQKHWGDGLVAFSLADLPDTGGKTVRLKLRWRSFEGMKQTEFRYCSRQTTEQANLLHGNPQFVKAVR